MAIIPPYLTSGDCIGLVCPAGYMPYEKAETCIKMLKAWGYRVKVGKTVGNRFNYFSGTDAERLADLQQMLDDQKVHAVLCARGGYGTGRIIDKLDFKKFCRRPKWIIGFSDVTVLHCHILQNFKIAGMHAPMAAAFNNEEYNNEYVRSLYNAISGVKADYLCDVHEYNNPGTAQGVLVGGNLSLLAHLTGTPSEPKTKKRILFVEDIGEYIYNVDRMFYQLKRSGKLDNLAGLIIGGFSEMKDTTIPYGTKVYDAIYELVKDYPYPVAFGFPVSHERENYALKTGVQYKFLVDERVVRLTER